MAANGGDVKVSITGDDSGLEKALQGVKGKAESTLGKIGKVAGTTTKAIAAIAGAVEIAGGAIAKVGMDFESAFAQVQTIMDPTEKSIGDMKTEIMELSEATGVAATELSGSVYNAISATGDTANSVKLVGDATKLATAGFTDTESALGVLTTAINAYGMEADQAEKISDSLVMTQNLGVTTIAQLSSSMGKAIASASAYGIDLYNVEAAYVAMTKSGISTAESTTYMSSMFKELGDSGSSIAKLLKEKTGQSFDQLMASGQSLGEVLNVIYEATGKDATALMNMWSSAEAGKAANAIINQGFDNFAENLDKLKDSTGATESAYETMIGTLEHQTQALVNSVKNLGVAIYEDYSGEMTSLVSEAGGWMSELAEAYDKGGIDALGDAAGAIAPKLIKTVTDVATKAMAGVSAKLPGLVKNLVSALPALLQSLMTLAPTITEALFQAFGAGIEALIPMLPSIITDLMKGMDLLFASVVEGIGFALGSVFNGIEQAFHQGQTKLLSGNWIDEENVKKLSYKVESDVSFEETGLTAEDVINQVNESRQAILNALEGIEGVDAHDVTEHIMSGDISAAIADALDVAGVDPAAAEAFAETVRQCNEIISGAIGGLGLDEEAEAKLYELTASGATKEQIEAYLQSIGIDPSVASESAQTITDSRDTMTEAIGTLPEEIQAVLAGVDLTSDRETLVAVLQIMKLDPNDIKTVLDSYDSVSGYLAAGVKSLYDSIGKALTDGKPDDPEGLKESVQAWANETYEKIEQWYAEELENLTKSGKTGTELDEAIAETTAKYEGVKESVQGITADTDTYIDSMAGKSTAYVQEHLGELEALGQRATEIAAGIDALSGSLSASAGEGAFQAVRAGVSEETVVQQAISFKFTEFKVDTRAAQDAYEAALADLETKLAQGQITEQEFEELLTGPDGIKTAMDKATTESETAFAEGLTEMAEGLAEASGVGREEMAGVIRDFQIGEIMEESLAEGVEGDWFHNTEIQNEFKSNLARMFQLDPNDPEFGQQLIDSFSALGEIGQPLAEALQKGLDTGDYSSVGLEWQKLQEALMEGASAGMDELETGAFGQHIKDWIDQGVFDGIEQFSNEDGSVDFSSVLRGLAQGVEGISPVEVEIPAEYTMEGSEGQNENTAQEYAEEVRQETEEALSESGEPVEFTQEVHTDTEVSIDASGAEDAAEQASEAAETAINDAETGETVVIARNANIELNVTATVTGTDFNSAGAEAAGQFAEGIASGEGAAGGAAAGLGAAALAYLKTSESAAQTLGYNFAQGYAQGISNGTNLAIAAAVKLAAQAIAAVKRTQDSASPSKVTAGLGRNFGEGYEIGIRESMQAAVDTARMMTGEILNASAISSNGLGVLRVEAGNEPLQVAMEGADKPVYLDGVQIASIQGGNNAAQLAWQDNRSARGVGNK